MLEEAIEWFRNLDPLNASKVYELSDMRVSLVRFLVMALFIEGLFCSVIGIIISNGLLAVLGGVNVTISILSYLFRVWLK